MLKVVFLTIAQNAALGEYLYQCDAEALLACW